VEIRIPERLAAEAENKSGKPVEKCLKEAVIERLFPGETLSTNA